MAVQLKKYYLIRSDGRRQRYATTLRRLRKRGYVYSKTSRAWQYAREGTPSGRPVKQIPRPPPQLEPDFVEWTLFARMVGSKGNNKKENILEGEAKQTLPKGEQPDRQTLLQAINGTASRKFEGAFNRDFAIIGLESKPTNKRGGFIETEVNRIRS